MHSLAHSLVQEVREKESYVRREGVEHTDAGEGPN